jgi:dipeptidyl aminopeptidase/acylaminoacyl peptidase
MLLLTIAAAAQERTPRVYKDRITPHWFADNTKFWYRNDLPGGQSEFIVIDAATGARERVDKAPGDGGAGDLRAELQIRPSSRTGSDTTIAFQNKRGQPVELFWIDPAGERKSYGKVDAGARREINTYEGHVWLVATESGDRLGVFEAEQNSGAAVVDDSLPDSARRGRGGRRNANRSEAPSDRSPDRAWTVRVKENNLFIKSSKDENEIQLTKDGAENQRYGRFSWSPDSQTLVAFRVEPGDRKEVHLLESSPSEGGRAKLRSRPYSLPGDKFTSYELNVFDIATGKQIKPQVDKYEHEWTPPRVHWWPDGKHFSYSQVDRGHQRFRVIDVAVDSGAVRNLVDERSKTFIWTHHMETLGLDLVNWLKNGLIYASEQSGWRHLYYFEAASGKMNAITKGDWVVRGIESIDETNRTVTFQASGIHPDQDPYFVHYGRANFDGSGVVWLTEGNGNHTAQFSPDRKYIIDTYSRVDAAPVNELRRVADGKLICKLEQADTSELQSSGWKAPEVFVAKGRDGKTDIWGLIFAPRDFDPQKKYPILEDIYAGPHGSFVPKNFSAQSRYREWNKLGFVVVKIDGMGTANRSKAFHDICWQNLKDGGFEDRILWMKAAAKKFPYLDIDRVGVFGTSAGGQNAGAAVLFHPRFYKAAVANCGCHDNRMDKASWNEQWMGYPVGPQYSQCSNIDNAHLLKGALFLIVGELDSNVPPESTIRFADALIKAGKDFDFLLVPGENHGTRGPAANYVERRARDFFVRHLMDKQIPNRNAETR